MNYSLTGRKIIDDRASFVEKTLARIDQQLDSSLILAGKYALSSGGKRLRPVLCILACELVGGSIHDTIQAFTALELIHNATLIHDDILDDDEYRRGTLSTPGKYGLKTAVLTGDALLSLGLRYASQTGSTEVVRWLSEASLKMVSGINRQFQINSRLASESDVLEINYLKSGSLFEAATALGALRGGAYKDEVGSLALFGRLFGEAYQIKDDLLDITNNGAHNPRGDLQNGNITLPIIYALESGVLSSSERKFLEDGAKSSRHNLKEILTKTKSTQRCCLKIKEYTDRASAIMAGYNDSVAKNGLLHLLDDLTPEIMSI